MFFLASVFFLARSVCPTVCHICPRAGFLSKLQLELCAAEPFSDVPPPPQTKFFFGARFFTFFQVHPVSSTWLNFSPSPFFTNHRRRHITAWRTALIAVSQRGDSLIFFRQLLNLCVFSQVFIKPEMSYDYFLCLSVCHI